MENLIIDKEDKNNKRKRRCSTQVDESIKKKVALQTDIQDDGNSTSINNVDTSENGVKRNTIQKKLIYSFLEDLCDEVLYEIFQYLDTWSLMSLMNVCERFQHFVMDKRFWENIDLSQQPLPLGILEDKLERSHNNTKCIKLRGPSPSEHIEGEIQHFNKTILSSFTTRCTKLTTLELYGVTLDFTQMAIIDFPKTLKRIVLNTCNARINSHKLLFTGIDTSLANLEELAIEYNTWFDPYYVMSLSKLPILRYLSLRGCWQMQEFVPYGSIAARHGFKQLEILDLRDTPLGDSDLQCFNAVETLKEIYLQYTKDVPQNLEENNRLSNVAPDNVNCSDNERPTTSSEQACIIELPSTSASSRSSSPPALIPSSSPSSSTISSLSSSNVVTNNSANPTRVVVPLVGTNSPSRSRFLPRSDHIFVDVRNPMQLNNYDNYEFLQLPVIERMLRQNMFWDIVTPLGRVMGSGRPDRLFIEDNSSPNQNINRQQPYGNITDRGVCCFGRPRQPVQHGVIWIRFNNRPSENRFERFSVRDYKRVTDVSLRHLVQCSPHLIFLDVSGTSVTLEGLQSFKGMKPECEVVAEHLLGSETTGS